MSDIKIGDVILRASERQRCEVWTRVMGYHRPVSAFNPGKQAEHAERLHFREDRVPAEPRAA
ncbi:MAG TPA: oxidoreductase [Chromatiales bacterium]|nr:oxidoreductase [Chromatiales bacterium]